jgi:hypothetical protein
MIDWQIVCEFTAYEPRLVEETDVIGFAAANDVPYEVERHAARLGARYNSMPRRRGARRWEIREPGELLVVVRAEKIP